MTATAREGLIHRGSALAVIAAVLVGGVLGFGLGRSTAPPRPAITDDAGDSPPREPRGEAIRSDRVRAQSPADRPSDDDTSPEAVTGPGVITGTVRLASGEPLAGVLVRARLERSWPDVVWDGSPREPDLDEQVRDLVRRHRTDMANRREARTGESGRFRLESLADRSYTLNAWLKGHVVHADGTYQVRPGADVRFIARPLVRLSVRVIGTDGAPVASATVRCRREDGGRDRSYPWSSGSGALHLLEGSYRLRALAGPEHEQASAEETMSIDASREPEVVTLRLAPRRGLRGRVTFEDGLRDGDVVVTLLTWRPGEALEPERLARDGRKARVRRHDGRYRFLDLAPGTYAIGVLVDADLEVRDEVTVTEGFVERDLIVPAPDRSDTVIVRVLGPDGRPLADPQISTAYRSRGSDQAQRGRVVRLPDGSWRARHAEVPPERLRPDGRWLVDVLSPRLGRRRVEYDRAGAPEVLVPFGEPASLTVTVRGIEESGLAEGLRVDLAGSGFRSDRERLLGPDGTKTFRPLEPGAFEVHLLLNRMGSTARIASTRVDVGPGANHLEIAVPRLHDVEVRTEGVPQGGWIALRSAAITRRARVDEDGRARFRFVPPGAYEIRTDDQGDLGSATVDVPGGPVRYVARPANALAVTITNPEGAFAHAGLRTGDLIIGANGREFESMGDMRMRLMGAHAIRLLVRRGSERLEVAIDVQALRGDEVDPGGRLEPASR